MECANKIEYVAKTHVRLVSPHCCINKSSTAMNLKDRVNDIRKMFAHEKGVRSKVIAMHAIESEAREIHELLRNFKSP